jgi:hypothetical protein
MCSKWRETKALLQLQVLLLLRRCICYDLTYVFLFFRKSGNQVSKERAARRVAAEFAMTDLGL